MATKKNKDSNPGARSNFRPETSLSSLAHTASTGLLAQEALDQLNGHESPEDLREIVEAVHEKASSQHRLVKSNLARVFSSTFKMDNLVLLKILLNKDLSEWTPAELKQYVVYKANSSSIWSGQFHSACHAFEQEGRSNKGDMLRHGIGAVGYDIGSDVDKEEGAVQESLRTAGRSLALSTSDLDNVSLPLALDSTRSNFSFFSEEGPDSNVGSSASHSKRKKDRRGSDSNVGSSASHRGRKKERTDPDSNVGSSASHGGRT